jgi:UDP-glucuronate 4-epimerase
MAMFLFTHAILNNKSIKVFNKGKQSRDFTYIDDIVTGVEKTILIEQPNCKNYRLYNIGNGKPVKLLDFIKTIENVTGKISKKEMYPIQPGDVEQTWADTKALEKDFDYKPKTSITDGITKFVDWYKDYYL